MTPNDRSLIQIVAEDLVYLRDEWDESIEDASLRRSSPVLRRLLIGEGTGDYSRAWRAAGLRREPNVSAFDLRPAVRGLKPEAIKYAQAGGAEYSGIIVQGTIFLDNVALSAEEIKAHYEAGPPTPRWYGLREFLDSPSIMYRASFAAPSSTSPKLVEVSRRQVIKYVANKLGGAHLDPKRSTGTEDEFVALDQLMSGNQVASKDAVYYELLSIGQSVARAPNTQKFVETARAIVGK